MKKCLHVLIPVMAMVFVLSCKKSGSSVLPYISLEGLWAGTYNTGPGGPVNYFSLNFKPGGALVVHANNVSTPDIANGNWILAGDGVKGSYTFVGSSGISSFAANYTGTSNLMDGTTGVGSSTTGESVFSVTKQ